MAERVRFLAELYKEPIIFFSILDCIYELHLKCGVDLCTNKRSNDGALVEIANSHCERRKYRNSMGDYVMATDLVLLVLKITRQLELSKRFGKP